MLRHKYIKYVYIFLLVVILWNYHKEIYSLIGYFIGLSLVYVGILAWGSFDVRLSYFTSINSSAKISENKIAITFDDGPSAVTPEFLNLLRKYQVKATFFCIGTQVVKHPNILKQIHDEGHIIGNHSMNHPNNMGFLNTEQVLDELRFGQRAIEEVLNKKTKLYRPPFGVTNPTIGAVLNQLEFVVIGWNIRSLDTVIKDPKRIAKRMYKKLKPGGIILMHDTSEHSLHALEYFLQYLEKIDYTIVPLQELINLKIYET